MAQHATVIAARVKTSTAGSKSADNPTLIATAASVLLMVLVVAFIRRPSSHLPTDPGSPFAKLFQG